MHTRDFQQITWDDLCAEDCRQIVRLAIREDLERQQDWTTLALVPRERTGAARFVPRQAGVVAGMRALAVAVEELDARLTLEGALTDGDPVAAGHAIATLRGNVRDLLTSERILLNLLGRMMGVATLTSQFVALTAGASCRVYDTRKTLPGWRRLDKYAVRCGGGHNHRTGLYDAVLIKDNHLAQFAGPSRAPQTAADAVRQAREFLREATAEPSLAELLVEIEVDSLEQLAAVLPERPDIVLLDNMPPAQLRRAVAMRDDACPTVQLEASGGVDLSTLRSIAATGVDRVSVGALTHSAPALDVGLDYVDG
ncbi:MAG TPA: carboxylating nicotinate-nucleotide diphosphorylase [Lacipirellulaceae bacterium]|nr:carboxylating nicotinate-nucleotide diphosphorylase [Lacipirellulaceae bacterium]